MLADLAVADVADSKQSFAERLGHWLNWTDAIALSVALDGSAAKTQEVSFAPASSAPTSFVRKAKDDLARVRAALVASITEDATLKAGKAARADTADRSRTLRPEPAHSESMEAPADYSTQRRHYIAQQRAMETSIGPLRARMRAALAGQSANASKLAALDAVLDDVLRERENHLLASVPTLLEKRFEHWRQAHLETLGGTEAAGTDAPWLPMYRKEMHGVLLAELEIRLQPVEGLLEALHHEASKAP